MGKRKYTGLCVDCRERPATHPPIPGAGDAKHGCCERCWRRRRYNDPSDNYREMVAARKVAWRQRNKQREMHGNVETGTQDASTS